MTVDWKALAAPFPPHELEWRIQSSGKKGDSAEVWAKVVAYVTNRAIQQRLDDVVGPENWQNHFEPWGTNGVLCRLGVRVDGEWIWKEDGAENTEIESLKGGLSGAMKRAAVHLGIGRMLYDLPEGWAKCFPQKQPGAEYAKTKDGTAFYWLPPDLPKWALPSPPEKGDTHRNGSPPVMGPPKDVVMLSGLTIVHVPHDTKPYWKVDGNTEGYEKVLKELRWRQSKTIGWWTADQASRDTLEGLLAPPPQPFTEMPRQLEMTDA